MDEFSIDRAFEGELVFRAHRMFSENKCRVLWYHLYVGSSPPITFTDCLKKSDGTNIYSVVDDTSKVKPIEFNWLQKELTDAAVPKPFNIDNVILSTIHVIHK